MAKEHEVATELDIVFAEHDGVTLLGDLYLPKGLGKAPVVVGVHGGGWQIGDRKFYTHWGNYLATNGYAVFAIEYRLMKPGVKTWPGAVYDTKAAVQFVRAEAARFGLDADRVGLIGDSAGAHLSALVALAGNEPLFSGQHLGGRHAEVSAEVKAVVGFYGVYDMLAQWEHDQITRPRDQITEKLPSHEIYFDLIDRDAADWRIFLLTDEAQCIEGFLERYGSRVTFTNAIRSSSKIPVHLSRAADRVRLGADVLKDVHLALRCQKFIGLGMSNPSCIISVLKDWCEGDCILLGPSLLRANFTRN